MTDTLFADVSEWQVPVNDEYPHQVLSIRSNDGTYRDKHFAVNYRWSCDALNTGKLKALIVYCVYRSNWEQTLATAKATVGSPHPRMAMMIDVESWNGQITGDQSGGINGLYWGLTDWLGDHRRVIGYGNTGDLNSLWPTKPHDVMLVVAAYGRNPNYPGKLAHQFSDNTVTPPFGACDLNSADGMDIDAFCSAIGIGAPNPTSPPIPPSPTPDGPSSIGFMNYGDTSAEISRLQEYLNRMFSSYSHINPISGYYGDQTTAVVKEFQRRVGIVGADGRNVGELTRAKLWEHGFKG